MERKDNKNNKNLILDNIDNASKLLKVAKGYGTQYYNNFIPKNAIYGRLTKTVYIYCIDLKQFGTSNTLFDIYIMDTRTNTQFSKILIKKYSPLYNLLFSYIDYNDMYDIKVEYCLHMKDIINNGKVIDTTVRKFNSGMNFVKTTKASKSSRYEIPLDFAEGVLSQTMVTKFRTK